MIATGVPTEDINEKHMLALIEDGIAEKRTVEYKRELPGGKDDERKEFFADVSSFANAGGGDLIYGIEESDGMPIRIAPLTITPDKERLTWEQAIRGGIEPRLPGVTIREIAVSGGYVLLMRIPRSWVGPHAVTYKKTFRFYSRTSAGKYPLDVAELRSAFLGASGLTDQIRNFRTDRLGQIVAGDEPIPLAPNPKIVAHLIPFNAFTSQQVLELNSTDGTGLFRPIFQSSGGMGTRWNIDGLLTYDYEETEGRVLCYSQLFRNGIFEGVDAHTLRRRKDEDGDPYLYANWLESNINTGLANPLEVLRRIGVQPPIAVLVSVVGAQNYAVRSGDAIQDAHGWKRIDRDMLNMPDVVVDSFEIDFRNDLPRVLRPIVDAFWQSGGWWQSPQYDAEGNWSPKK